MKKQYILFSLLASSLLLFQCSEEKAKEAADGTIQEASSDAPATEAEADQTEYAVCIWEKVAVRENPEEKGKYLTSVNLAEKVELLGEQKIDEGSSKKKEYWKIKMLDGKEGWIIKDFIVAKAKPAVFTGDVDIYSRPDLLAKSNKTFKRMDIIAVSEVQDDWCKITGKRSGGTWIDEGWVKSSDLSYTEKDIAVALYGKRALALGVEKQPAELQKIIENNDFTGSVFIADLQARYDELTDTGEEEYGDDVEDVAVDTAAY